jgi:hypothetical protein
LREVQMLGVDEIIWDAVVTDFAAQRQKSEAMTSRGCFVKLEECMIALWNRALRHPLNIHDRRQG